MNSDLSFKVLKDCISIACFCHEVQSIFQRSSFSEKRVKAWNENPLTERTVSLILSLLPAIVYNTSSDVTAEELADPLESVCLLQSSPGARVHHWEVPLPSTVSIIHLDMHCCCPCHYKNCLDTGALASIWSSNFRVLMLKSKNNLM